MFHVKLFRIIPIILLTLLLSACSGGVGGDLNQEEEEQKLNEKIQLTIARMELQQGLNEKQERVLRDIKGGRLKGCEAYRAALDADPDFLTYFGGDVPTFCYEKGSSRPQGNSGIPGGGGVGGAGGAGGAGSDVASSVSPGQEFAIDPECGGSKWGTSTGYTVTDLTMKSFYAVDDNGNPTKPPARGSDQEKLYYKFKDQAPDARWDRGYGLVNGRYMIAMNSMYGKVGDNMTAIYQDSSGKEYKIPMIMADIKRDNDSNSVKCGGMAGHSADGKNASIIEFEVRSKGNGLTGSNWHAPGQANNGTLPKDINQNFVDIRNRDGSGMRLVKIVNEGPGM